MALAENTLARAENVLALAENVLALTENVLALAENVLALTENVLAHAEKIILLAFEKMFMAKSFSICSICCSHSSLAWELSDKSQANWSKLNGRFDL